MARIEIHDSSGWHVVEAGGALAPRADAFVWVRLDDQADPVLDRVACELDVPQDMVRQIRSAHPHLRIEPAERTHLVSLSTVRFTPEDDSVDTGTVNCLVGERWVVSLERGEAGVLDAAARRVRAQDPGGPTDPWSLVRTIAETAVEGAQDVEVDLSVAVARMERLVFSSSGGDPVERIYGLKREVSEAREAVLPLARRLTSLATLEELRLPHGARGALHRLADGAGRCADRIDAHDRLLGDMLSAHLTQVSVRQNSDMRKISAWAAIVAVPTLVSGVYGMNFTHMPELSWAWAYPGVLCLMAALSVGLYFVFKRSHWL